MVRLYQEFMDGKTTDYIKRIFEREGVKNWDGGTKWQSTTLMSMLENEKYKGDALLQKSYTVDFLTKKRTQNKGKFRCFMWRMTTMPSFQSGYGNVYSLK